MSSSITPFNFDGTQVRVALDADSKPLFVLADVCRVLEIGNPSDVAKRLDADDLDSVEVIDSMGRTQRAHAVTESGVIDVTLDSRKPEARRFRRWLTHDVVPQIMSTGSYGTAQQLTRADLARLVLESEAELAIEREQRVALEAKVEADAPKVLFADAVAVSDSTILVGDLAKILRGNGMNIGANRLFALLRDEGYLIRRQGSDWNMPTQKSMDLGLFRIKETAITHSDGHTTVNKTPKVTGRGQAYFIERYAPRPSAAVAIPA